MQVTYTTLRITILAILFAVGAMSLTNCDKSNPVNVLPEDVAGTYDFIQFVFIPDAAALESANLLDTLVVGNTNLRLLDGGQFTLNYQFMNGPESIISGDFSVSTSEIRLAAAAGSEARLASLLLHSPLRLKRNIDLDKLESTTTKTVDLSAYSGRYAGVPPVRGRLILELVLRD
jgi:hypothetical protein